MVSLVRRVLWCSALAAVPICSHGAGVETATHVVFPGAYRVEVSDAKASSFNSRDLLGTHSLWWGFQSDLWMTGTSITYPAVDDFFRRTGGIIRFGGGANEIPWTACTGPAASRSPVKAVDWAGPMKCAFGVPEYLAVVRATGGQVAWQIANVAGIDHQLSSMPELLDQTSRAATVFRTDGSGMQRYWELGNELERGRYGWSSDMIARRAGAAAAEIKRIDPSARVVLPLIEYDNPNQPPRKAFNEALLGAMSPAADALALHLYYDGAPGGPSVPTQLRTVFETSLLNRRVAGQATPIWITEHGRWPQGDGRDKDWKSNWYKTNDMDGVLATADFLIGLSQIKDVAGAMLHGLRAGPWNVFDKTPQGPAPSGVGKLLLLFGDSSPGVRLRTKTYSLNQSQYNGGYDMRAVAFEGANLKSVSAWLVNRATVPIVVSIALPASAGVAAFSKGASLLCPEPEGRCVGSQFRLLPLGKEQVAVASPDVKVTLPARSVSAVSFFTQR